MKVKFIKAMEDHTWTPETLDIPAETFPEKLYRGSIKWDVKAVSFAVKHFNDDNIAFLAVLDANPENEQ